tara:strand:- start:249 stop:653 length:405 start_codon:yes stop_codon:yes gene_type:complete
MTLHDLFNNPSEEYFQVYFQDLAGHEQVEYYDTYEEAREDSESMELVHGWEVSGMVGVDGREYDWDGEHFRKQDMTPQEYAEYIDDCGRAQWEDMKEDGSVFDNHRVGLEDFGTEDLDVIEEEIGAEAFYKYIF